MASALGIIFGIVGAIIAIQLFLTLFVTVDITVPGAKGTCTFPQIACDTLLTFGFPSGWLCFKGILWYAIIPLSGLTLVIYGFLDVIHIFGRNRNKLYGAIAFLSAFSTVPFGGYVYLVAFLFAFIGQYAMWMFVIMFILGAAFMLVRNLIGWGGEVMGEMYRVEIKRIDKEKDVWRKRERTADNKIDELRGKVKQGKISPADATPIALQWERERIAAKRAQKSLGEAEKATKQQAKETQKLEKDIQKAEKE